MESDITTEEYELLSDDDKKLYYQNVDINTQTKEQKSSYSLWSDRIKRYKDMLNKDPYSIDRKKICQLICTIDEFRTFKSDKNNQDMAFEIIDELCASQELIDKIRECEHDNDQQRIVRIAVLDKLKGLEMTDIKFDNFDAFILKDCLHLLVENLYLRIEECKGKAAKYYNSPLTDENKREVKFALTQLSKVLERIDRDKLCPNWKELEKGDPVDVNGVRQVSIYGYHRLKRTVINMRDPRTDDDQT